MAILSDEVVRRIRADYDTGRYTHGDLARREGLHINTIGRIIRNETRIDPTRHYKGSSVIYEAAAIGLKKKQDARQVRIRDWNALSPEEQQKLLAYGATDPNKEEDFT